MREGWLQGLTNRAPRRAARNARALASVPFLVRKHPKMERMLAVREPRVFPSASAPLDAVSAGRETVKWVTLRGEAAQRRRRASQRRRRQKRAYFRLHSSRCEFSFCEAAVAAAEYSSGVSQSKCRLGRLGSRSEEHTSELQSRENLVCRLLL